MEAFDLMIGADRDIELTWVLWSRLLVVYVLATGGGERLNKKVYFFGVLSCVCGSFTFFLPMFTKCSFQPHNLVANTKSCYFACFTFAAKFQTVYSVGVEFQTRG